MVERLAGDYHGALTQASLSSLLELSVTLGSYRDSIVLVGGWVPYLLLERHGRGDFAHVGSIDIDLAIDPGVVDREAYASIVELIEGRGYRERRSRTGEAIPFSFSRPVHMVGSPTRPMINVDFLASEAERTGGRHRHRRVQHDLPARIAKGCELAFHHRERIKLEGTLPDGGETRTTLWMLDIPGCIGMKGTVLGERYKEKDAYDIYTVVGHCLDGPEEVAGLVREVLDDEILLRGIGVIREKFRSIRAEGPVWVATFLQPLDARMRDRLAAEAFVVLDRFLGFLDSG